MYYVNTTLYYRSYPIAIVINTNNNSLAIIVVFEIIIAPKNVQKTTIKKFHLTVKIDFVDEVYYLKLVFTCYFIIFSLTDEIDLFEVVFYLKHVFRAIIIIIMCIFMCLFSREHVALSYKKTV